MDSETLDYAELLNKVIPKKSNQILATEETRGRFTRLAFDVFTNDEEPEEHWVLEADDEGNEFFTRTFDGFNKVKKAATNWNAYTDKSKQNITLAYKDMPIFNFGGDVWPFTPKDADIFCDTLVKKAEDKSFVSGIINMASQEKKEVIFNSYPELKEIIE